MSGRSPPLYCTLILITMRSHQSYHNITTVIHSYEYSTTVVLFVSDSNVPTCPAGNKSACQSVHSTVVPGLVYVYVCVCVCVCVFIKLHITAQSGLVILVILCHSR